MSKVKRSLLVADFHKLYAARMKDKGLIPKSPKEHRRVIKAMGQAMSEILLEKGIIGLPWRNGDIFLKKKTSTDRHVTFTNDENNKRTRSVQFNDHSDGIVYTPFWLSPERLHKKRKAWCFSMFRDTKRILGKQTLQGKSDYPDYSMLDKRTIKKAS